MTPKSKGNPNGRTVAVDPAGMKSVLMEQKDFLLPVVQEAVQAILRRRVQEPTAALLAHWMNLDQMGDVEEQERWPVCRLLRAGLNGRAPGERPLGL